MSLENPQDIPFDESTPDPKNPRASQFVGKKPVSGEGVFLDPNRHHEIDNERLVQTLQLGEKALVVAGVRAGNHEFGVIDTRHVEHFDAPLLLVNMHDPKEYRGIWPDQPIVVGTDHPQRFTYQKGVSRTHFTLNLTTNQDQEPHELHLQDADSTNGTLVSGFELSRHNEPEETQSVRANYTRAFVEDMSQEAGFTPPDAEAPHGRIDGHPVIGDKSRSVRNGAYGTTGSELLIVDNENPIVTNVVNYVMRRLHELAVTTKIDQRVILREITAQVAAFMRYNFDESEKLSSPHYGHHGRINLSEYVSEEVGICRHQNILTALVIEQAIDEGLLEGAVGVQRNIVRAKKDEAHAWTTFLDTSGHLIIVDTAQNGFVGTRDEAKKQGLWNYYIPDTSQ